MDDPLESYEPPRLRLLRRLVTVLTLSLIGMVVTVAVLFVLKFREIKVTRAPELPAGVALPKGESAQAVTFGTGWHAIVTRDETGRERIRVLGNGAEQVLEIE